MDYWIVVVDDEPLSLKNAKMLLGSQGMKVSCLRSGTELLKFLEKNEPDLILLDVLMPEMDGFETISAVRDYEERVGKRKTPIIFLTGESDSEIERRGLREGASDFVHKPLDKDILISRITRTIDSDRQINNLTQEATLDKLTGFLNKASGTAKVSELCSREQGALIIFDLDNFKLVNDLFGHDMGDRILVAFASVVRRNIRSDDVASRVGGDEFMVFFPKLCEEYAVSSLTERLNSQLMTEADALMGADHGIPLGISAGVAFAPGHSSDYQVLFQYADTALYKAKQSGKHRYSVYESEMGQILGTDDLEHEISRIAQIMEERGSRKGALLLGKDTFSWNYRFITRFVERYDAVATQILFSLSDKENGIPSSAVTDKFATILKNNLRKSDIIYQNRPYQFFVALPLLGEDDKDGVIGRISKAFLKEPESGGVEISYASKLIKKDNYGKRDI